MGSITLLLTELGKVELDVEKTNRLEWMVKSNGGGWQWIGDGGCVVIVVPWMWLLVVVMQCGGGG